MCLSKTSYVSVLLVSLLVKILTLEVLQTEKTILKTESTVRNITNQVFLCLGLKGIKNNTKLKHHSLIHNFFTKLTLKDQHTLAAVTTLSQLDKNSISNKTQGYIDILNELQQEDSINHEENAITNNINVIKFVDHFLSQNTYNVNGNRLSNSNFDDVLDMLQSDIEDSNVTEYSKEALDDPRVLSDHEFWEPEVVSRRIFRGERTKIKYFPFMASIQIFQSFQCGGAIIKSDLVITAASCLQLAHNNRFFRENPAFLSVRVGSTLYQGGGENIPVLEVYFHPGYDPKTLKDNLSIVRLVRKINLKKKKRSKVKKIAIDRHASRLPSNTPGITIVGWGSRTTSNIIDNPFSNRLAYSTLDVYSWHDCRDIYSRDYVSHKNFCAGFISKGSGACNKDAGDPGISNGILVGVASFGTPVCGTPDSPTVFTKVGFYADWIDDIIDMPVPETKRYTTLPPPSYEPTTEWIATKTTFKVEPIVFSKKHPMVSIQDADALRILNEDEELKEMLDAILSDEDDKIVIDTELNQLGQSDAMKKPEASKEVVKQSEPPINIKRDVVGVDNKATKAPKSMGPVPNLNKYTVLDPDLMMKVTSDEDVEVDKNIVDIIKNVGSKSVENLQDYILNDGAEEHYKKMLNVKSGFRNKENTKASENLEDNVLTLLYLSDEEKAKYGNKVGKVVRLDVEEEEGGLSIAIDDLKDYTYKQDNGTKRLYDMLPRDEWYDLLTEAIEEVTKNKRDKTFRSIILPVKYKCPVVCKKIIKMCLSSQYATDTH